MTTKSIGRCLIEYKTTGVRNFRSVWYDTKSRRYYYNIRRSGRLSRVYVIKSRKTAGKNRTPVYIRKLGPPWG